MKATRELLVRCVQEWEFDPDDIPDFPLLLEAGNDARYYDQDIIDNGALLSEEIYFDVDDDEFTLTIAADELSELRTKMEPWIDPDVMAS